MYLDSTGKTLGEQLKVKRTYDGKRLADLSQELGIPMAYLSQFENNKIVLSKKHTDVIKQYLQQ